MEKKKLYRSEEQKMLCGVCGGIAEYFELDPTIVRLIFLAACFAGFSGIIAYIVAAVIIPKRPQVF